MCYSRAQNKPLYLDYIFAPTAQVPLLLSNLSKAHRVSMIALSSTFFNSSLVAHIAALCLIKVIIAPICSYLQIKSHIKSRWQNSLSAKFGRFYTLTKCESAYFQITFCAFGICAWKAEVLKTLNCCEVRISVYFTCKACHWNSFWNAKDNLLWSVISCIHRSSFQASYSLFCTKS